MVVPLGWRSINPALLVAERLGTEPGQLMVSAIGGNTPQAMMHDACLAIGRGDLDVVLVTGSEAMYTRALSRRNPAKPSLHWVSQPSRGGLPIHAYPLFENALRGAHGWSMAEHAARIGALWSRFSEVAAGNPHAWIRQPRTPEEISLPSEGNRMISFPYPKLATANMQVDQGAGYIVCSVEAARSAGVAEDRWVFPLSGADANDHWFISHRPELHRSPAIRLAGQAALALGGVGIDDVGPIDLYSCFPAVVQMAAHELGLPIDDPARPLTLTGGLTFGGGPGNNYTSHGIARCVEALRAARGARAWAGTPPSTRLGSTPAAHPRGTLPGAASKTRWMPCPSAGSTPKPPATSGSRPTRSRSIARATPSAALWPAARPATTGPGATSTTSTPCACSAPKRESGARAGCPRVGCSRSTECMAACRRGLRATWFHPLTPRGHDLDIHRRRPPTISAASI